MIPKEISYETIIDFCDIELIDSALNKLGYDATFYAVDPDVDYEPFQTDDVAFSGRYTIDEDTDLEQGFWVTAKLKSKAKADAGKYAFVKAKDLVDSPNIASWEK